jgi:hypothetical protein
VDPIIEHRARLEAADQGVTRSVAGMDHDMPEALRSRAKELVGMWMTLA